MGTVRLARQGSYIISDYKYDPPVILRRIFLFVHLNDPESKFYQVMIRSIVQTYRISFAGLSRETWLLSIVVLVNRCGYMAVPFMSMYITQSLHRSIADAGLIITLFGVGSVMGAMAGGYTADKIGFRPVQVVSLVTSGILFVLFGQISDFRSLCVLTVVLSFFVEAFKPANNSAIASYSSRENMTRSYALNRLAINIGFGFGTAAGGVLAAVNYHLLFWVDGIVYVVAGFLILVLLPAAEKRVDTHKSKPPSVAARSPWKDVFFLKLLAMVTLYMIAFILLFRLVPVYWKEELHIGEATIGLLIGMNGVIIAVFEMVMIQKLGNRRADGYYIIAGTLFTGVAYLFLIAPAVSAVIAGIAAVLSLTIGEMLALPYLSTMVMDRTTEENRGTYSAAYSMSWAVAQIIGPAAGGYVASQWGYNSLWVISALISVASALGFRLLFQKVQSAGS
jgi:predicted MFS family arabinose efflux permease